MSVDGYKLEKDLCRCCHQEGSFKSLYAPYFNSEVEIYADMIRECLDIELTPILEPYASNLCTICRKCIQRLREAYHFKKQVLKCEQKFRSLYVPDGTFSVPMLDMEIKEEVPDEPDEFIKTEKIQIEITPADDDNDVTFTGEASGDRMVTGEGSGDRMVTGEGSGDNAVNDGPTDDRDMSDDGLEDFKFDDEDEPLLLAALKKKKKPVKSQPKTKKKPGPKKKTSARKVEKQAEKPEVPGTVEIDTSELIAGNIKVVKRPPIRLEKDVDYKSFEDSFQCCRCEKQIKSRNSLLDHVKRVHLKVSKYICRLCDNRFQNMRQLTVHKLKEHNIDKRYKCNACNKKINTPFQLTQHNNNFHKLGVNYKCDLCDYECFGKSALVLHQVRHKTVKGYHCKYCSKSFLRRTTLEFHERIHTGDKRKVCEVCGQAFVQKASLNYHMTKYHPAVAF